MVSETILGALVGVTLMAVTATALLSQVTGLLAGWALVGAIGTLSTYTGALLTYIPGVTTATAATWGFYLSLVAVAGILTAGILPAISAVSTGIAGMNSRLDRSLRKLEKFQAPSGRVGAGTGAGTGGGGDSVFIDVTTNIETTGDPAQDARLARKASRVDHQALDRDFADQ